MLSQNIIHLEIIGSSRNLDNSLGRQVDDIYVVP